MDLVLDEQGQRMGTAAVAGVEDRKLRQCPRDWIFDGSERGCDKIVKAVDGGVEIGGVVREERGLAQPHQ